MDDNNFIFDLDNDENNNNNNKNELTTTTTTTTSTSSGSHISEARKQMPTSLFIKKSKSNPNGSTIGFTHKLQNEINQERNNINNNNNNNNNNKNNNNNNKQMVNNINKTFTGSTLDNLQKMGVSSLNSRQVESNVIEQMEKQMSVAEIKDINQKLNKVRNEIKAIQEFLERNTDHIKSTTFAPNTVDAEDILTSLQVLKTVKEKRLEELNNEEVKLLAARKRAEVRQKKEKEAKQQFKPTKLDMNAPSSLDKVFGFGGAKETENERLIRLGKITPFANAATKQTKSIPIFNDTSRSKNSKVTIDFGSSGKFSKSTKQQETTTKRSIERNEKRKRMISNANKQKSTKSTTFYDDLKNDLDLDDISFDISEDETEKEKKKKKNSNITKKVNDLDENQIVDIDNDDKIEKEESEEMKVDGEEQEDDEDLESTDEENDNDTDYVPEDEEEEEEVEEVYSPKQKTSKGKRKTTIDVHEELWKDDTNEELYQDRLYMWKKERLKKQFLKSKKEMERLNGTTRLSKAKSSSPTKTTKSDDIFDDDEDEKPTGPVDIDDNNGIDEEDEDSLQKMVSSQQSNGDEESQDNEESREEFEKDLEKLDEELENEENDDDVGEDFVVDGEFKIPYEIYHRLFEYQVTCVRWMWELHEQESGGMIGDEMGLGKTIQIISFLASLHYSKMLCGPALIVAPATLLANWVKEIHKWWPPFRVILFHSSNTSNKSQDQLISTIANSGHILLTTYEGVRIHQDMLLKHHWEYIILDEGHKIRNPDADVTLSVKQFPTCHRIILSGSPIQNKLTELWSLFDFIFPGKLGTLPIFMSQFSVPINLGGYANASSLQVQTAYKCAVALRDLISPYMLRRVKSDVLQSLPSKNEQVLLCPLTPFQERLYLKFLASNEAKDVMDGKKNLLYAIDILKKICNHPDILHKDDDDKDKPDDYGNVERSSKLKVVQEILPMWQAQGHKVLLFCQTRQMLDIVQEFVKNANYNYRRMDGTTTVKVRQTLVEEFNNDPSLFIFLLTTKVGGLGINLTGANRVILFDPDWNPSTDIQARERVYRIGQKKAVTIYRLMTTGTIEEKIYHRQIYKQFLSNKILKDPRQKRFFQSKHFKDLLSYIKVKKGSETGDIFTGTNSEILPEDFHDDNNNSSKRRRAENGQKLINEIPFENSEDQEKQSSEDSYILKHLFEKEGLKSALKHDSIMEQSAPEAALLEEEANKIAKKAVELLKVSRQKIEQTDRFSTPTWTGRSGTSGAPQALLNRNNGNDTSPPQQPAKANRFGNKSKAVYSQASSPTLQAVVPIVSDSASLSNTIRNATDSNKFQSSSSDILKNLLPNEDAEKASEIFGGIKPSEIIEKIYDFLIFKGGSSSTQDIIEHFKISITSEQAPLFRSLLKSVATFSKPLKLWCINKEIINP